jgi:SAM-dependent methyltransferase
VTPVCRGCGDELTRTLVDLGTTPLANAYVDADTTVPEDPRYPLHARVCDRCLLVQIDAVVPPDHIFSDYAYFSSYSPSWVEHARRYADAATRRFGLDASSLVVEIASNDGYLLKHFVDAGIPVLGVEPAANVAEVAIAAGVPTDVRFFGRETAEDLVLERGRADLVVANNVLAHVPELHDFIAGIARMLSPSGACSIEVPHVLRMLEHVEFDTIYHEHFSYFSLHAAGRLLAQHGLRVFDVEELPTHGGSLRIWACRGARHPEHPRVANVLQAEREAGIHRPEGYAGFAERVEECRRSLLAFLGDTRSAGKSIVAYGAAAKGNTLLNYCGITTADIPYVVDRSPHKQGRLLPGSRLPIADPERIRADRPDYVLILPWNLRDEIIGQLSDVPTWGGRFVTPVPTVAVHG